MSMPQASISTGTPLSEVTVSSNSSAPWRLASSPTPSMGCSAPVEVSACTRARILAGRAWSALSSSSISNTSPHGFSRVVTSAPYRDAISAMRDPKKPFTPTITWSPLSMKLHNAASMPALPVPETASVNSFVVWNTNRSNS